LEKWMNKSGLHATGWVGLCLFFAAVLAQAQERGGPLFEQGMAVFEENCEACHKSTGEGIPPNFPALDGNQILADQALIVRQVRAGKEAMPPFSELSAEEIAAVTSYVRNAWSNGFGPVTTAQVESVLATVEVAEASRSIWDGVYSSSQAKNARLIYLGACAPCHGRRLNGAPDEADMDPSPPLAGSTFLREWEGKSLATLFEYARTTMPIRNPGQFTDEQYADVIAYMLSYGDIPAGSTKLMPDIEVLADIVIAKDPPAAPTEIAE
jgi:mono/diheme cytochrome c family protein